MRSAKRILIRMLVTQPSLKIFNKNPEEKQWTMAMYQITDYVLNNVLNQPPMFSRKWK